MSNIKIVYFDSESTDSSSLIQRLTQLCADTYRVGQGVVLVKFNDTPQSLYSDLGVLTQSKNILIMEVDPSAGSYWGYMDKSLWDWLKSNRDQYRRARFWGVLVIREFKSALQYRQQRDSQAAVVV